MYELHRYESTQKGTLGKLVGFSVPLFTVEPPWRSNRPNVSCIPEGIYTLTPHQSPTFGKCVRIVGGTVSPESGKGERTHILIHPANWAHQLQGCIAPGTGRASSDKGPMVTNSRDAVRTILNELPDIGYLEVSWS